MKPGLLFFLKNHIFVQENYSSFSASYDPNGSLSSSSSYGSNGSLPSKSSGPAETLGNTNVEERMQRYERYRCLIFEEHQAVL